MAADPSDRAGPRERAQEKLPRARLGDPEGMGSERATWVGLKPRLISGRRVPAQPKPNPSPWSLTGAPLPPALPPQPPRHTQCQPSPPPSPGTETPKPAQAHMQVQVRSQVPTSRIKTSLCKVQPGRRWAEGLCAECPSGCSREGHSEWVTTYTLTLSREGG